MIRFQRLPTEALHAFLDVLYERRGEYLRQVDEVLESLVCALLEGKRPVQPILFAETVRQLKQYPMDSDHFVEILKRLVSGVTVGA